MNNQLNEPSGSDWRPVSVYAMAAVCLVLGAMVGYLLRGSGASTRPRPAAAREPVLNSAPAAPQMPSLDDMKRMADKQAEPLLAKLRADPNNPDLLVQVAMIYQATHRFEEAAEYYRKALQIQPDNVTARTRAASCLYYAGDVDGALSELRRSLIDDPRNPDVLFNLGMIKWKGKHDTQGALNAWQKLLETNPSLEPKKKAQVQRLMAQARQHGEASFPPANQVSKE